MFKKYSIFFLTLAQSCMLASGAIAPYRTTKNNYLSDIIATIHDNNVPQLKIVLRTIPDINMPINAQGSTLLMEAARCGWTSTINALLKAGANPNTQEDTGMTALHYAAESGNAACVHALLFYGAISQQLPDGRTPLDLALFSNNPECICELAQPKDIIAAIRENNVSRLKGLLLILPDIDMPIHEEGTTLLMFATHCGWASITHELLKAGANPNIQQRNGMTALHCAAQSGNAACVHVLLSHGAISKRLPDGTTPFQLALFSNNLECIRQLANQQNLDTALFLAIRHNSITQIETVLKLGANVNKRDTLSGHTPLTEAIRKNNIALVVKLLEAGANPNQEEVEVAVGDHSTPRRTPPLVLAVMKTFNDIAVTLLEYGSDPNTPDSRGWTPLMVACWKKSDLVPELLIRNANPNAQVPDRKETALHLIVQKTKDNDHISLLRAFGADTTMADMFNKTPLDYVDNDETRIRLEETPQEAYARVQEIIESTKLAYITVSPQT